MKKHILFFIICLIQIKPIYSQINFKDGYFINEENQKINCLIKDLGWGSNPQSVEYKISQNGKIETADLDTVKEFGIGSAIKYIRRTVKIDFSSDKIGHLSNEKAPEFTEKQIFLKVLLEGKASLFQYKEGDLIYYFFSTDTTDIRPLIYKKYKSDQGNVKENNQFRQQLFVNFGVECFDSEEFKRLKYYTKDLIRLFIKYNECQKVEFVDFRENQPKMIFNLHMKAGLNQNTLSVKNFKASSVNMEFEAENNFKIGFESEFVLPVHGYKWSFALEPTYQYFKDKQQLDYETVTIDYQYLDLAFGIRHYFYFGSNSKLFLNGLLLFSIDMNSSIDYSSGTVLDIKTYPNFAAGFGYQFYDMFSLEFRYQTKRQILADYVNWDAKFNSLSLILGFVIFNQ